MTSKTENHNEYEAPQNPFFKAWAEFVIAKKYALLPILLVITGYFQYQSIFHLKFDNSNSAFTNSESSETIVLNELYDYFGRDALFQVIVEGDVFSMPYLERLRQLHQDLAAINLELDSLGDRSQLVKLVPDNDNASADAGSAAPAAGDDDNDFGEFDGYEGWGDEGGGSFIEEIVSLINVRQTSWRGGGLKVEGLLDTWPSDDDLPELKKQVLANQTLVGQVVSPVGTHSVVNLRIDFMDDKDTRAVLGAIRQIAMKHQAPGFKISVTGMPAINTTLNQKMARDFLVLGWVALLIMTIIVAFIFRHPLGVVGPILAVFQSTTWMQGIMAASGAPMTMVTNVLPAFIACVGIGSAIHIQSVYRDARAGGLANEKAIIYAVSATGIPVTYATLTTGVGLLSFYFASLDAIANMGIFGALGIVVAAFQSLVFLPIVLTFNKKSLLGVKTRKNKKDWLDRFLAFCNKLSMVQVVRGRLSYVRPRVNLVAIVIIVIVSAVGASMIGIRHDPLSWLPADLPVTKATHVLDDNVGGVASVFLLIQPKEGKTLKDRDLLVRLEKLEAHIKSYQDPVSGDRIISAITGPLDVVRESWRAVNDSKQEYYKIPDSQRGVIDMFTLFENSAPTELRRIATVDMMNSLMTIRVKYLDAWSYKPLTRHIEEGIEAFIGDTATIKVTGSVFSVVSIISALISDLVRSFGTAFIAVTIIMICLLRTIKLGLISMVPNLLPVVVVMGIMGFFSIPIDVCNLIIGSIIIGIAVDDTIHFLHQFRVHYSLNKDVDRAIGHAFSHTGRAMVSTSIILVLGFADFILATMSPLHRFGVLTGMAVTFALVFNVLFGPALLRTFYRSRLKG